MPAFSASIINTLNDSIRTLYRRRLYISAHTLTFDQYMEAFVPAEARASFREASQWALCERTNHRWELLLPNDGEKVEATLRMHETVNRTPAPLVPRKLKLQMDAPRDIVDGIYAWAENGGDPSREFGRTMHVLHVFNENFSRLAIRYYWPTILALCSEHKDTKSLGQELQELRMPPKLKPLPSGLPLACRQTAQTIANAKLIPTDVSEPEPGEVTLNITTGQYYKEDFGSFYGLC